MPHTVAIIQARMSSSRLPGKVLLDVAGEPMLARVYERVRKAKHVHTVAVATTTDDADDAIARFCLERDYPCTRGSLHDVLDRYYQSALTFKAEMIVRVTADCPIIDPQVIDLTIDHFIVYQADFAANRLPPPWTRSLPIGLDTEVCSFSALERAWQKAAQPFQREHVMPYLYEGVVLTDEESITPDGWYWASGISPRGFQILQLHHHPNYGAFRWTVDTPQDMELLRQIYTRFTPDNDFSWQDILELMEREPELAEINASVPHKTAFDIDHRR